MIIEIDGIADETAERTAGDAELMEAARVWAIAWQGKEDNYKEEEEAFYKLAEVAEMYTGPNR